MTLRLPHRQWIDQPPLVSMILTTRDRPRFMEMALACYAHQEYPNTELIVVDDGDLHPVDDQAVAKLGGIVIHTEPGTPLGAKLNLGCDAARGMLCQKMDDDDWYGPQFEIAMVEALLGRWKDSCRPSVAVLTPFRFFDLARWEIRQTPTGNVPGATLLFPRQDWRDHPFRPLPGDEDVWFFLDQLEHGSTAIRVAATQNYLAVRHRGLGTDRGHTWVNQFTGQALEDDLLELDIVPGGPDAILPEWALHFYRSLLISPPA